MMIYLLDTMIWYAVWAATTGLVVGLEEKLGDIRNFKDIRNNFMRAPEAFCIG